MTKKKVVSVTYGGGHINAQLPVLKLLRDEARVDLCIVGLTIAGPVLEREGFAYKTYRDYYDPATDGEALKLGEELLGKNFVPGKGMTREDSLIYLGLGLRDTIAEYGEAKARELIRQNGKKALLPVGTMTRVLERERADLLLTGNCPRSERAATLAANRLTIPSINISDYLATEKRHHLAADRIAVMSEITRENLIATGHDPGKIVVTGQPSFDSILRDIGRTDRDAYLRGLGLDPRARTLVVATQKPEFKSLEMVRVCAQALKEFPGHRLIIKPHPGEDEREFKRLLAEEAPDAIWAPKSDIRDLINISDALVTFFSTCGLEAVLMGKPFIALNLCGIPSPVPLHKYGVALEVDGVAGMVGALHSVWEDEKMKRDLAAARLKWFGCVLDGQGGRRVTNLVYELLEVAGEHPSECLLIKP